MEREKEEKRSEEEKRRRKEGKYREKERGERKRKRQKSYVNCENAPCCERRSRSVMRKSEGGEDKHEKARREIEIR